jgi:DNA-binding CsgD family transcriptional regulator
MATRTYYGPWRLTPAECHALDCICVYESNAEAARRSGVALRTLENQLVAAYNKLGVGSRRSASRLLAIRTWLEYHGAVTVG